MAELFDIKQRDIFRLARFYRRAPRQFGRATGGMLNEFAFGVRREAFNEIERRMKVRNPRFVNSRLRVHRAVFAQAIDQQYSETGSISSPRFSGWKEQQLGTRAKRTRVSTLFARGNQSRQIKPAYRLKPAKDFVSSDDYKGSSQHRVIAMLAHLKRKKYNRPFIVKRGHRKLKPGLYKYSRSKLRRIQNFQPTRKQRQPRRIPWLTGARDRYFSGVSMRRLWTNQLRRVLKY